MKPLETASSVITIHGGLPSPVYPTMTFLFTCMYMYVQEPLTFAEYIWTKWVNVYIAYFIAWNHFPPTCWLVIRNNSFNRKHTWFEGQFDIHGRFKFCTWVELFYLLHKQKIVNYVLIIWKHTYITFTLWTECKSCFPMVETFLAIDYLTNISFGIWWIHQSRYMNNKINH